MMTPKERELFKEEEKAHLRKLKALQVAARRGKIHSDAKARLAKLVGGIQETLGTHNEFIDKLDRETVLNEARVELAIEVQPSLPSRAAQMQRADALVSQISAEESGREGTDKEGVAAKEASKTIGRMPSETGK
jgi:hypothetical protein